MSAAAGVDLEFTVETEQACVANTAGDGIRHGGCGLIGGEGGAPHRYLLREPGRRAVVLDSKQEGIPVAPGSTFEVHSAGGGGWGEPGERDREARRRDRRDGIVTRRPSRA